MSSTTTIRTICHLDLDAFYAQVEQKRLGIPRNVPVAVQQWEGLIAVNYAARAAGITRHMRVNEAKQKCPELICCHVQTLGVSAEDGGTQGPPPMQDRSMQKACLERYRQASMEIMLLLRSQAPKATIEKASIDEAYIDLTAMVDAEMHAREGAQGWQAQPVDAFGWGSIILGGQPLAVDSEFDRRLSVGAAIVCRLRGAVLDQLEFTCSAGIANNKLLAKVASAMHKPNQQTLVPPRAVPGLMKDLPLKKLRNYGGKLGEQLSGLGCKTAGEVSALPMARLEAAFGRERALSILEAMAGRSNEPVEVKDKPQSMLACKSFNPTSEMPAIHRWFHILAEELASRIAADYELHQRRPCSLVVHYRLDYKERSRSAGMPRPPPRSTPSAAAIAEACIATFQRLCEAGGVLPTSRLAISAHTFVDAPSSEKEDSIVHFFGAGKASSPSAAPPPRPQVPPKAKHTIKSLFSKAGSNAHTNKPLPTNAQPVCSSTAAPDALGHLDSSRSKSAAPVRGPPASAERAVQNDASHCDDQAAQVAAVHSSQPGNEGVQTPRGTAPHGSMPAAAQHAPGRNLTAAGSPGQLRPQAPCPYVSMPHEHSSDRPEAPAQAEPSLLEGQPHTRLHLDSQPDARAQSEPANAPAHSEGLEGVSVSEQKRILREIWLESHRQKPAGHALVQDPHDRSDIGSKRPRASLGADSRSSKQTRISSLFNKK